MSEPPMAVTVVELSDARNNAQAPLQPHCGGSVPGETLNAQAPNVALAPPYQKDMLHLGALYHHMQKGLLHL
jgi:hypothetical protein